MAAAPAKLLEPLPSSSPGIQAEGLVRDLGGNLAVNGISLEARFSSVLGILGPNGAGKTTLLRMLAGLLEPSAGRVRIRGREIASEASAIRNDVGILTGTMRLYENLTPIESLRFFGKLRRMPSIRLEARIEQLVGDLGMSQFCGKRYSRLSAGERQRAAIANTLLHDPGILILDEITANLDILSGETLLRFVHAERARGKCIVFSTHIMSEAEYLCDRILMIHQGQIADEGTAAELVARRNSANLTEAFLSAIGEPSPGAAPGAVK